MIGLFLKVFCPAFAAIMFGVMYLAAHQPKLPVQILEVPAFQPVVQKPVAPTQTYEDWRYTRQKKIDNLETEIDNLEDRVQNEEMGGRSWKIDMQEISDLRQKQFELYHELEHARNSKQFTPDP